MQKLLLVYYYSPNKNLDPGKFKITHLHIPPPFCINDIYMYFVYALITLPIKMTLLWAFNCFFNRQDNEQEREQALTDQLVVIDSLVVRCNDFFHCHDLLGFAISHVLFIILII